MSLKAGMIVSTGAATGIHDILAGQRARLVFHGCATLEAHALPSLPNPLGIRA
jgi:2-keto-4-pentenoate hydratase